MRMPLKQLTMLILTQALDKDRFGVSLHQVSGGILEKSKTKSFDFTKKGPKH